MSFGEIYSESWFGQANDAGGWGSIYPFDADGSLLLVDTTSITSDSTAITADATQY
tara:strand:+ start:815 stop:982 length:168 start_codon:yes stop_codon:yes gene_type:complete